MKEFFGIGGYTRTPEGYLSWQHLVFVTSLMVIMTVSALVLGKKRKNATPKEKNNVLVWAALLIDGIELIKIVMLCYKDGSLSPIRTTLPLFLCSLQLIALPLAAFSKNRVKEAATDFVCIFGILGAVLGVYGAGQNYNAYPVLSLENVASGLTHAIAGFGSLYIMFSGLASLKKKNILPTCCILVCFSATAYVANRLLDYNYMFLMSGDGTPYDILFNLVGGSPVLYPLGVVGLFFLYIASFYGISFMIRRKTKTPA